MADLLNVDDALEQILSQIAPLSSETTTLQTALTRVLAHDVLAKENLPQFANSSMDGFALRAADLNQVTIGAPAKLKVVMDIPAGVAPDRRIEAGEAARIMTGAPMPDGADAVIPVEDTDMDWQAGESTTLPEQVQVSRRVKTGDYVRPAGESVQIGQTVLQAGTLLRPQDIGILASLGHATIQVVRQPRVAIVSTGDELVDVSQPLAPGKIRDSNSLTIAGLVAEIGGIPTRLPVANDTFQAVRDLFKTALEQKPDVIISSAGVSVGTYDVVRTVLDELGEVGFWRVNVRPGKPLAFGNIQQVPFFGLPGNPVSAMVTFDIFVHPTLLKMQRRSDKVQTVSAIVGEDLNSDGRRGYLRVRLERDNGKLIAHTTGTQSSGALMSMVQADGLLIIPENMAFVKTGTELPVRLLRQ